ncbi:MAG: cupin domain-containing protein [Thermoleophilaceae bacterium]
MSDDKSDDPDRLADQAEHTADDLARQSDKVAEDIERTRSDWERKQDDESVPGAISDPAEEAEQREAADQRDRARTGQTRETVAGEGFAVGHVDAMGDGPGFRKIRRELDVEELGVNAVVIPEGYDTGFHFHDEQEELYFVHRGTVELEFGDGSRHVLDAGGLARVAAPTHRRVRNVGEGEALYVIVGAKGGYVGHDGRTPEDEQSGGEHSES